MECDWSSDVCSSDLTTGVALEVIDGDEEAALAFAGATAGVAIDHPVAVVDVGGGSTEVVVGDASGRLAASVSMQLGCVRVTERDLVHDPVDARDLAAAAGSIATELDRGVAALAAAGAPLEAAVSLVAVAGTATTLAALHLGLASYEEDLIHGTVVPLSALAALTERLVALDAAQRDALGPMQPGRADVIHGGALVLLAVARRAGVGAIVVSERDGLDALAASLLDTRV
jgi:exopolyphosphatase/guanosine-5'-triphosphate,3'-diphosphate pyrophosphatase